jgi:tRNA A-37 threonylcarbamoyl transferase component Bud32
MSVIWRAEDELLKRGVAVKVLASDLAVDSRHRELVRAEARAAAALMHPNVTATYDYGETFNADGELTAYVVMELLEGEPLSARVEQGPLPWPEATRICAEVAEGLAAAHRHGIVHRDITADNVMLTPSGAKVMDFGIAAVVDDDESEGFDFGTPAYVAPERLQGRKAKPANDTYALGVLLYETLTGQPPYPAETWEELATVRREQPPPRPDVAGLPEPVVRLVEQCLALEPKQRPSASQVAWTLRKHLPGAGRRYRASQAVRRALAVASATAAVVFGVLVGVTLGWEPESTGYPPPAADSPQPEPEPDQPAPAEPGGGSAPDAPASPSPSPEAPFNGVPDPPVGTTPPAEPVTLGTVSDLVDEAEAANAVRADVALDLRQTIDNLQTQVEQGNTDVAAAAEQIRDKVETRAAEGSLSEESAAEITAALDALEAA